MATTNRHALDYSDSTSNVGYQDLRNFIVFYFGLYLKFLVSQLLFFSFLFLFLASSDILHYTGPPLSYTQAFLRYSQASIPSRMGTCGCASGCAGFLRLQVGFHVHTYHSIHQYHHLFSSMYPPGSHFGSSSPSQARDASWFTIRLVVGSAVAGSGVVTRAGEVVGVMW